MEIVDLTSDDDLVEDVDVEPSPSTLQAHYTSNSSDKNTSEYSEPIFDSEEDVPVAFTLRPKIIGPDPEDGPLTDSSLETDDSGEVQVPAMIQDQADPKPGTSKLVDWVAEEESASVLKKRPPTSPTENQTKKRNIEFDDFDSMSSFGSWSELDPPVPVVTRHHRLEISAVTVDFPLVPYPAQKAVMNAVIKGCRNSTHSLVESPTGSGKTLALLCGVLAWQSQVFESYNDEMAAYVKSMSVRTFNDRFDDSLEKDFLNELGGIPDEKIDGQKSQLNSVPEKPTRPPKIYYGCRTHLQIAQVTKELKRTVYRNTKMTILSSRDFTCIQGGNRNKTELCNELLDPCKKTRCVYYNESNKQTISHYSALSHMGFSMPFDIEDIVKLGNERGCCPYFAAKNLMAEAELVLCPYNYLIDPFIRKSMQLNLDDAVIILDEAHNIEDVCRSSASTSFTIEELTQVMNDCLDFHNNYSTRPDHEPIFAEVCYIFCSKMKTLIETMPGLKKSDPKSTTLYSPIWNGSEFQKILEAHSISNEIVVEFLTAVTDAADYQDEVREDTPPEDRFNVTLPLPTIRILERYQYALQYLLHLSKNNNDFRIFVKEGTDWLSSNKMSSTQTQPETPRTLECLCMNPGLVFSPLAEQARSIILASGTLSPIVSFASELRVKFEQILHSNHVIRPENVHIRVVSTGPGGTPIRATYQNTSQLRVQDEIGRVIVNVCNSVPFGVLCFVPSYTFLNILVTRMTTIGAMNEIPKIVFTEPKQKVELDTVVKNYRRVIKDTPASPPAGGNTGALLFAVFRGKVAEGVDFSDNEARAVITIGIPYAVQGDPVVSHKIKYNDQNLDKQLLPGIEWYRVQAFRALNQALGRCIRHINDWGAIVLVDERLLNSYNHKYLPMWLKTLWGQGPNTNTHTMRAHLSAFVNERIEAAKLRQIEGL